MALDPKVRRRLLEDHFGPYIHDKCVICDKKLSYEEWVENKTSRYSICSLHNREEIEWFFFLKEGK